MFSLLSIVKVTLCLRVSSDGSKFSAGFSRVWSPGPDSTVELSVLVSSVFSVVSSSGFVYSGSAARLSGYSIDLRVDLISKVMGPKLFFEPPSLALT
jgi:hypothetical protein